MLCLVGHHRTDGQHEIDTTCKTVLESHPGLHRRQFRNHGRRRHRARCREAGNLVGRDAAGARSAVRQRLAEHEAPQSVPAKRRGKRQAILRSQRGGGERGRVVLGVHEIENMRARQFLQGAAVRAMVECLGDEMAVEVGQSTCTIVEPVAIFGLDYVQTIPLFTFRRRF